MKTKILILLAVIAGLSAVALGFAISLMIPLARELYWALNSNKEAKGLLPEYVQYAGTNLAMLIVFMVSVIAIFLVAAFLFVKIKKINNVAFDSILTEAQKAKVEAKKANKIKKLESKLTNIKKSDS